jgi:hypothetical protein
MDTLSEDRPDKLRERIYELEHLLRQNQEEHKDVFAMFAMQAIITRAQFSPEESTTAAKAYDYAGAMLKEKLERSMRE